MLVLKDVLKPRLKPSSSGGEEFQPNKYHPDTRQYYPSHMCYKLILLDF